MNKEILELIHLEANIYGSNYTELLDEQAN